MEEDKFDFETADSLSDEPLVREIRDIDHPCRNCHMLHEHMYNLTLLKWLKNRELNTAGDSLEEISAILSDIQAEFDSGSEEDVMELRKAVGKLLADSLDELDKDIEREEETLRTLAQNCEGTVSMSVTRNNRLFGAIVCGSAELPDGDHAIEPVHMTRISYD